LAIRSQEKRRDHQSGQDSENGSANNVRQIMRSKVHPGQSDHDWNREESNSEAAIRQKQRNPKSGRRRDMPGRK
jgi:hypothetical protein